MPPRLPARAHRQYVPVDMTDAAKLAAIRQSYIPLREDQRQLNKKLQTMLPKQAIPESARQLGLWHGGGISVALEDHLAVLIDFAIYDYRLRGRTNAVERLWRQRATKEGTTKHLLLEAMQSARFTVLRLVEPVPGTGAVVDDIMHGGQHFLADLVLSENSEPGLTMGTRVLTFPEFIMTTGASFLVEPEPIERIVAMLHDESSGPVRIRELVAKDKSWLAAVIIGGALAPDDDDEGDYE